MKKLNLLILNSDLPFFPGRAGHEYLHTTRLAQLAQRVGLVSLVHVREQYEKKQGLADVDRGKWALARLNTDDCMVTTRH